MAKKKIFKSNTEKSLEEKIEVILDYFCLKDEDHIKIDTRSQEQKDLEDHYHPRRYEYTQGIQKTEIHPPREKEVYEVENIRDFLNSVHDRIDILFKTKFGIDQYQLLRERVDKLSDKNLTINQYEDKIYALEGRIYSLQLQVNDLILKN